MEHYGHGILFVERACIFKTKEENEFLLKPIILIGTDILINCDFISLVYQKKSYLYIFFLPLLNKSFIISYIICRDYIVQKRQLADDLFVALK